MTEFKDNHLKVGDRVRYLDRIPHDDERYYGEWDDLCPSTTSGVVIELSDGYPVVWLDDENIFYGQVVHPDNLEKIE